MIFQEPMTALNPVFKIGMQVSEPLIYHQGLSKDQALNKAIEILDKVGIPYPEKRIHEDPQHLVLRPVDGPAQIFSPGRAGLSEDAHRAARLGRGHSEGFFESFANLYREMADAIPDAKLVVIKGADHGPQIEAREAWLEAVRAHLERARA